MTEEDKHKPEVFVCDAIMGSGKTESAITYIREHPNEKFIYITPYLSEASRIKESCPEADFVEPARNVPGAGFRKIKHIAALINAGKNITSTHAAFTRYTAEMLDDIRRHGYTIIIDEALDILTAYKLSKLDEEMLIDGGYLVKTKNGYTTAGCRTYSTDGTGLFASVIDLVSRRECLSVFEGDQHGNALLFWLLPRRFISAFDKVIVMTYMIEGQEIGVYLKASGYDYKKIGVARDTDGTYRFGKFQEYIPEYVKSLKDKIHILDHKKLNALGEPENAFSMSWLQRDEENQRKAKNALGNLYKNIWSADGGKRHMMWGTFKGYEEKFRGRGMKKSYLVFNARAMNGYRDKTHLAYLANVYINTGHRNLFVKLGVPIDGDAYALSTLIQWVWRSAIRDGKDIWLYLPSSRMRKLLANWIDEVSKGGGAVCASTDSTSASTAESSVLQMATPVMSPAKDATALCPCA